LIGGGYVPDLLAQDAVALSDASGVDTMARIIPSQADGPYV
jgi:hypothetical protein